MNGAGESGLMDSSIKSTMHGVRGFFRFAQGPPVTRPKTPKQFSAYLVTWSDEPSMPVDGILIDKGSRLEADWNVMNFETGKSTSAVGRRLSRLCPECRVQHRLVGILGHDGECGTDDVRREAQQVLADAKKRVQGDGE